ncbi:MAG: 1-phosphofructokinase family hexose kinase, partial [Chloroflexi bacterium]|nr:1-phosphofructokinase family hexose kinase [Chloroflexota bacterium]
MAMIYTVTLNPAVDREFTVPAIEFNRVLRATNWRVDVGGKGFNVSRMLMALGVTSTAIALVGGRSGERLRDGLTSLGINTNFVWVSGETRTNVSIITAAHDRYLKVNEPGPTASPAEVEACLARVRQLARPGDWWVLAGSLPPGISPHIYAEIIAMVQERGARALLDSSGDALKQGCAARPYLVKPNAVEAQALTGLSVHTLEQVNTAAAAIQELGVQNVVISLGKQGALCR